MDVEKWTKQFGLKVLDKIEDNVAAVVAGVIIFIGSALCIIFWKWLKTEHTITTYGFVWVTAVFLVGGLPALIFWLFKKKKQRIKYREDEDISVVLENKLRELEGQKKNQIPIDFRIWDKKLNLMVGSTKKLLPKMLETDNTWKIKSQGGNFMTIIREDSVSTVIKNYYKR